MTDPRQSTDELLREQAQAKKDRADEINYGLDKPAKCRGCGADISFKKTAAGKWTPVNPDGTPHWATCPKAKEFKRGRK